MKMYALLIAMSIAMAGCSTSLKGSVGSAGNQDASKNSSSVASPTGVCESVVVTTGN